MNPFEEATEGLRAIRYRPHHNCQDIHEFLGLEVPGDWDCEGDSELPFVLPDGSECQPGQWLAKVEGEVRVVDSPEIVDLLMEYPHRPYLVG